MKILSLLFIQSVYLMVMFNIYNFACVFAAQYYGPNHHRVILALSTAFWGFISYGNANSKVIA
ncbi:MAG: hypothetical protein N2738_00120 [Thermodesulfovibrionales bacterium]|nr:hypothetical protein [Thermodesulfovibrionales bacterium]